MQQNPEPTHECVTRMSALGVWYIAPRVYTPLRAVGVEVDGVPLSAEDAARRAIVEGALKSRESESEEEKAEARLPTRRSEGLEMTLREGERLSTAPTPEP